MKKKLNTNKLAIAVLTTMVIGTSSTSYYMYDKLTHKIEVSQDKLETANMKINEYNLQVKEMQETILNTDNTNKDLLNKIKELESTNETLKGENKQLKELTDKILNLPQWDAQNVTSASNVSEVGLGIALKDTGLEGLESAFIKAEATYGINAIFLTSLVAQESGWGNSSRAKRQNNLSGYAVYSDSSAGKTFSSKTESILVTAELLRENYVNEGLYSISSINNKYSADEDWDKGIHSIASDLVVKANVNNYINL
jgi:beta-N-acetylglucosaminidase